MTDAVPAIADPVAEADAIHDAVRAALHTIANGDAVDITPIGERVARLTAALTKNPPSDCARALAAREGLGRVVRAFDDLEAALAARET